jgi:RNA polymerase sigma factor for flagellar operon FliA
MKELLSQCLASEQKERPNDFDIIEKKLIEIYKNETGKKYPRGSSKVTDTANMLRPRAASKIKDLKKKYSPEEVVKLWEDYENDRTLENRNKLIEHYLYLLYKPVKDVYPVCRNSQEEADIFQSAVIGLIEAVEMYSKEKNTQFKTFSRWRIHGSIIDYLRKSSMIALPYKVRKKINDERLKLEKENIDYENPYNITSLDALDENPDTRGFAESLQADISSRPDIETEEKIMLEEVYKILKTLPLDEYETIVHYYFKGKTLDEIAKLLKMTRSGVWQVRKRAIESIRRKLKIDAV